MVRFLAGCLTVLCACSLAVAQESPRVFVGYQGWFTAEGDGADAGWTHYKKGRSFAPGSCTIDLWPDLTGFDEDETYATPFRHKDGRVARVFSSHNAKTVARHFGWMREYGIDGAFVQRFATRLKRRQGHWDIVLDHCRKAAEQHGRAWAVMYDLSGLRRDETRLVLEDWKRLERGGIPKGKAYLRLLDRPVVAVWGVGFGDGRQYTLGECGRLIDGLKASGCTVMLGIPSFWREQNRDAVGDPDLHAILRKADILSPWTVGRYRDPKGVERHAQRVWKPDLEWCRKQKLDYMPVVFPGFSWHNMKPEAPLDQIPRRKGAFLWSQFVQARKAGAEMVYVAMFDEIDEGTAIFKCTNDPPVGTSRFLTYEGLPSDHYLWLTGQGRKLLDGALPVIAEMPKR